MAYASITYTSASGTTFALTNSSGDPIEYLRQNDISVTVNGILKTLTTDYTFNTAGTAIVLNTAVSGATVVIARTTDIADATVSFTAGSTLTAQDLNNSDKQNRFALQEFSDTYGALTTGSGDLSALAGFIGSSETWLSDNAHAPTTGAVDNRIDSKITTNNAVVILRNGSQAMQAALSLGGFKITNLATPTTSTDASTKDYVDNQVGAVSASATAAAASASAAATSATNAASSASSASTSASNASTSASNAASSASSASSSASSASTSASNAASSATSAATSATSAASSAASALAAFDSFDDRYLGAKASDPTVDNDGDPLNAGDLYYNTTISVMKVYTGTVWVTAYVPGDAASISFTPYSTIAATNVQNAVQELTDEKLNLTGGTLTGAFGVTAGTAAAPSVFVSGDTNTGLYSPGADQVSITTGGTERLRIDSTGQIEAVSLGTAAAPTFTFTGDPNTGIYSPGADQVAISTGGTRRLVVDADGNIAFGSGTVAQSSLLLAKNITGFTSSYGITNQGAIQSDVTTSAIYYNTFSSTQAAAFTLPDLHHYRAQQSTFGAGSTVTNQYGFSAANTLSGAANNYGFFSGLAFGTGRWAFYASGGADSYFASNNFIFANGGTEKARFDSSGRLLIGASSAVTGVGSLVAALQVQGISGSTSATQFGRWTADSSPPNMQFHKSRGASVGTHAVVVNNDNLGRIDFAGSDGSTFATGARIAADVDGTPGASDMPGRLVFSTTADGASSPTERLRIDSSGRVGIGTTAFPASTPIQVKAVGAGAGGYAIVSANDENAGGIILNSSADNSVRIEADPGNLRASSYINLSVDGTERARLTASGQWLVGTSSDLSGGDADARVQVNGDGGAQILLSRQDFGALTAGTLIGEVVFRSQASGAAETSALIKCEADATQGSGDKPGRLVFSTTADGASSPTERMRIKETGHSKFSNTGSYRSVNTGNHEFLNSLNTVGLEIYNTNASLTATVLQISADRNTTNGTYKLIQASRIGSTDAFWVLDSGNVQNTNNSYTGTSDAKLKENIVDASPQWEDIKSLQVRKFNFKEETGNSTHTQIGLIAQEVEQVSPGLVSDITDRDAEGNDLGTVTKSVNYSVLYMKAVKALQEAMERIEQLEAEMAEVKAQLS